MRGFVNVVARTGRGSYIAKRDWDGAYRQARVTPAGFMLHGQFYYDVALLVGLSSSSAAHNWFAELFDDILVREVDGLLAKHFADYHIFDLIVLLDVTTQRLMHVNFIVDEMGVAFAIAKNVGPELHQNSFSVTSLQHSL